MNFSCCFRLLFDERGKLCALWSMGLVAVDEASLSAFLFQIDVVTLLYQW